MAKKTIERMKKFWQSKTLWANVLLLAAALLGELSGVISSGGTLSFAAGLNILLRLITTTKLDWSL